MDKLPSHPSDPGASPRPDRHRKAALRHRRAATRAGVADPFLTAEEAAPETGRALSTFWRDVKRGVLPAPYYVTPRAPRWRLSELRAAVLASPRERAIRAKNSAP